MCGKSHTLNANNPCIIMCLVMTIKSRSSIIACHACDYSMQGIGRWHVRSSIYNACCLRLCQSTTNYYMYVPNMLNKIPRVLKATFTVMKSIKHYCISLWEVGYVVGVTFFGIGYVGHYIMYLELHLSVCPYIRSSAEITWPRLFGCHSEPWSRLEAKNRERLPPRCQCAWRVDA